MDKELIKIKLDAMEDYLKNKKLQVLEDLQIKVAYLFRSK